MTQEHKINVDAARRLRKLRVDRGYAHAESFAKKHDLSVPTYRSHENASRNIPLRAAKKYAKLLGSTYQYILDGTQQDIAYQPDTLRDSEVAIIDLIKDIFTVFVEAQICEEGFLKQALNFHYQQYLTKNRPGAAEVVKQLQAFVNGESHLSERTIISQFLHTRPLGSA